MIFLKNKYFFNIKYNDFFLVSLSPWPLIFSVILFLFILMFIGYLNFQVGILKYLILSFILIVLLFYLWIKDVSREINFLNRYSNLIKKNIKVGFFLFIISEVFFFIGFFWAFFHFSLEPSIEFATIWPPIGLKMNSLYVPFLNTLILILSGVALNWVQYALIGGIFEEVFFGFGFVFLYGFMFLIAQIFEYYVAFQQINDSVFGSTLYLLTLFHGLHVIIGLIMLGVCLFKFYFGQLKPLDYLSLILASWYWHFVDIVWIFVFIFLYLWGTWISEDILDILIVNFFK